MAIWVNNKEQIDTDLWRRHMIWIAGYRELSNDLSWYINNRPSSAKYIGELSGLMFALKEELHDGYQRHNMEWGVGGHAHIHRMDNLTS